MIDLEALYRKLQYASFSQREPIADDVIRENPPEAIATLVRGLDHPHPAVRLGIIEIFRRATFREALRKLVEHATTRDGDDRVFAIRAIAQLAQPGDDFLVEPAQKWVASGDRFVTPHAEKIVALLVLPKIRPPEPPPPPAPIVEAAPVPVAMVPSGPESLDRLVIALFTAVKGTERISIVAQIEARGSAAVIAAAKVTLAKGNEHLVAYMCRAIIRQASTLPSPEKLIPLLEAARKRLGVAPIATAAIDDTVLALGGLALSPVLLSRIVEMEKAQVDALVVRLAESEATEVALHVPTLLDALARRPNLWSSLGPALVYAAPHVRESTRGELRKQVDAVVDELRRHKTHSPITVVSVCWVLARIAEKGEALSKHLRIALDRLSVSEAACALVALCARLATEEAATVLVAMLRDPLPEGRTAAREALQTWQSPWVGVENDQIALRYVDEKGQPLEKRGERLVVPMSGEEYVLDSRGRPTRNGETEFGGCLCCSPARALVKRGRDGLRCPSTWECHLRDGGKTLFEKDHPLGRCSRCESTRPRIRDGARVICIDCGAGAGIANEQDPGHGHAPPPPLPQQPAVPSEHGRNTDEDALPKPPTREELEHIAPHIRAAISSNMFIHSRDGDQRWNGSGIIIARDGNHIAILTNRHVVESDDRNRLCALDGMTVSGEAIRLSCVWRAKKGIDLALIEGRVENPVNVGVMPLGVGVGLVGAEVFAIGNPLGLAWSYTAGTLSAIRHWTTQDGQSVRILQTDANIAPGSSGGGLFHSDGHLLGVMSFLRQGYAGGSAHFALSIDAIREAFAREDVRWHGQALADLPK